MHVINDIDKENLHLEMVAWTSIGQSGCGYKQPGNGTNRVAGGQICGT